MQTFNLKQSLPYILACLAILIMIAGCKKSSDNNNGNNNNNNNNSGKKLVVSVFAGNGAPGAIDGTGTSAYFNQPACITLDASGNMYVGDANNNKIRTISAAGVVSTFAGTGGQGMKNGAKAIATFNGPFQAVKDAAGNVYVADLYNYVIRKIDVSGNVTTFATNAGQVDALVIDAAGNMYESDGNMIYKVSSSGAMIPFAGNDAVVGAKDGTGTAAEFNLIQGLFVDAAGNIYVGDSSNNLIRKVTPGGVVTTVAGTGAYGHSDGPANKATFATPCGVAVDAAGNIYVADAGSNLIRKIDASGNVTTIAGSGAAGDANGPALSASFNNPVSLAIDANGNIYVSDNLNNQIRKISLQ